MTANEPRPPPKTLYPADPQALQGIRGSPSQDTNHPDHLRGAPLGPHPRYASKESSLTELHVPKIATLHSPRGGWAGSAKNYLGMHTAYLTSSQVSVRWACHRTSVFRICRRFGVSGAKFGTGKTSIRRFREHDIQRIEQLAATCTEEKRS